jgi:hypothetical protein
MATICSAKDVGSSQRKKRGSRGRVGIARSVSGDADVEQAHMARKCSCRNTYMYKAVCTWVI